MLIVPRLQRCQWERLRGAINSEEGVDIVRGVVRVEGGAAEALTAARVIYHDGSIGIKGRYYSTTDIA